MTIRGYHTKFFLHGAFLPLSGRRIKIFRAPEHHDNKPIVCVEFSKLLGIG